MSNITGAASSLLRATFSEAGRAKLGEAINVASHITGRLGLQMSGTLLAQHNLSRAIQGLACSRP